MSPNPRTAILLCAPLKTGFSIEQIIKFNLPNSIPCYYELDPVSLQAVNAGIRFLADDKTVAQAMEKVASIGDK